jgi:hypothetical protein
MFANQSSDKRLILEYRRNSKNLTTKQVIQFKNWSYDLHRHFAGEEIQMADMYVKKNPNTINHQGSRNQNSNEVSLHSG